MARSVRLAAAHLLLLIALAGNVHASTPADRTEKKYPGDHPASRAAATYQLVGTYTGPGFEVMQFRLTVLPAHGSGSLCGAKLSKKLSSTIGEERKTNPYLKLESREKFVVAATRGLPRPPAHFRYIAALNRKGPPLVKWEAPPARTAPDERLTDASKFCVVDLSEPATYSSGHVPNSLNIGVRGKLETWLGLMVPRSARLVLCGTPDELGEAIRRLHRVGRTASIVTFMDWKQSRLPLNKSRRMKPREIFAALQADKGLAILDVRQPPELEELRFKMPLTHLPLTELARNSVKLDRARPLVAVCQSGYRSSIAVGVLERKRFENIATMDGGAKAWVKAGLPAVEKER